MLPKTGREDENNLYISAEVLVTFHYHSVKTKYKVNLSFILSSSPARAEISHEMQHRAVFP
jgi:hypothetical protein